MQEPTTKNDGSDSMDFAAEFRSVLGLDVFQHVDISKFHPCMASPNSEQSTSSTTDNNSENVVDSIDSRDDP